jgi:ArsR family transcriptional regulator, arsenate/arsenite/antimonite-responsive transcriptional repressor
MPMTDMLRVFKSLSDRTRLRIIRLLFEGDLCVCELMFVLGMAQSRVSHQLRILKDAGLVDDTRDGQWIIYRIPPHARATIAPLLKIFPPQAGEAARTETADRKKLKICLKEGIRKKNCPARRSRRGNAS